MKGVESKWQNIDLRLKSGKRVYVMLNPALISHIEEVPYTRIHLSMKFPFIKTEKCVYVKFRQWESALEYDDAHRDYKIDCNLNAFLSMFGLESTWTRAMMKADIQYGNHD